MSQLTCYELMQRRFSGPSNDELPSDANAEMWILFDSRIGINAGVALGALKAQECQQLTMLSAWTAWTMTSTNSTLYPFSHVLE